MRLQIPPSRASSASPWQAYANSKLCTLLAAKHLDRLFARWALQRPVKRGLGRGKYSRSECCFARAGDLPSCRGFHRHRTSSRLPCFLCPLACREAAQQAGGAGGSNGTAAGQEGRDASVAVHPGLVDTFLARNYFKAGWARSRLPAVARLWGVQHQCVWSLCVAANPMHSLQR